MSNHEWIMRGVSMLQECFMCIVTCSNTQIPGLKLEKKKIHTYYTNTTANWTVLLAGQDWNGWRSTIGISARCENKTRMRWSISDVILCCPHVAVQDAVGSVLGNPRPRERTWGPCKGCGSWGDVAKVSRDPIKSWSAGLVYPRVGIFIRYLIILSNFNIYVYSFMSLFHLIW